MLLAVAEMPAAAIARTAARRNVTRPEIVSISGADEAQRPNEG